MSNYTEAQLAALADDFENGLPNDMHDGAWTPGPYAWLLDVIDDFDAFQRALDKQGITLDQFLKNAVTAYLNDEPHAA
nr:hypothetical protein [Corynebacterium lactis]